MINPPPNVLELPLVERALMALQAAVEKVIEQVPVCAGVRFPVQDSFVAAVTLTEPVGPAPVPAAVKLMVTACWRVEGLGVFEVIVMVLAAMAAVVLCVLAVGAE